MKWEDNINLSFKVLKNPGIFTFPSVTKYITKEDKIYSGKNKFSQLNTKDEIISEPQKPGIGDMSKINYSFNFMRNTFIIIDMSDNSILVDFKPNRIKYIFSKLIKFIKDYFSYNFVSTITIIINHNCTSEILSPMSSDEKEIINNINSKFFSSFENLKSKYDKTLSKKNQYSPGGFFSLYNSLETIKEILPQKSEYFNNDVLIFNNSLLSYDNGVKNENYFIFKEIFEINVLSLEVPYEALKNLAINSGGKLLLITKEEKNIYDYNTNGDMDEFLHNFSCKFCKMGTTTLENPIKLVDKNFMDSQFDFFCFCHKKKQKIVYCCAECGLPFCYIPFFCNKCNLLNIDNTFLQLLLRAKNENDIKIKNKNENRIKCFPYKFRFYYEQYLKNENYIKNAKNAVTELDNEHKKELRHITEVDNIINTPYNSYPLHFQFKLLFYYLKYQKTKNIFFCDLKKNINSDSYLDLIKLNKAAILKDYMRCSGCSRILEIKDESDFDNIFIFSNCLDIFCLDCYKYLIKNNIGCLECTD